MNWNTIKSVIETKNDSSVEKIISSSDLYLLEEIILLKIAAKLRRIGFFELALKFIRNIELKKVSLSHKQMLLFKHLKADLLLDVEHYDEAIAEYSDIILKNESSLAYGNRGLAKWELGEYQAALEDYRKAVDMDSSNPILLRGFGEMLLKTNNPRDAIPILKNAISLNQTYSDAYTALGVARRDTDDWVKAYKCFQIAVSLNPNDKTAARGIREIEKWYNV